MNKLFPLKSLFVFIIFFFSSTVWGVDFKDRTLAVEVDASYVSKYIWRGYDVLDDDAAFQPSINLDLFETGFSLNVWGSFALEAGHENLDELDYTLAFAHTFFEEENYAIDFSMAYIYYDFPNTDSESSDMQEIGAGLSLPSLIPLGPSHLVPGYDAAYNWPPHGEGPNEGWFHIFSLSYDLPITPLLKNQGEQAMSLWADLTYNDGAYDSEPSWSHSTVGVCTSFEWQSFTLTPAVNYQWSFEDTVNEEDEFWASLSLTYSF